MAKKELSEIIQEQLATKPLKKAIEYLEKNHSLGLFSEAIGNLRKQIEVEPRPSGAVVASVQAAIKELEDADRSANRQLYRDIHDAISGLAKDVFAEAVALPAKKSSKAGGKSKATEPLAYYTLLAHVKASEGGASRRGITGRFIEPAEGLEAWVEANMKGKIVKEGKGPAGKFVLA